MALERCFYWILQPDDHQQTAGRFSIDQVLESVIVGTTGPVGEKGMNLKDWIEDADQTDQGNKTAGEKIHNE